MSDIGLTSKELKLYFELLIKANEDQLFKMREENLREILRRINKNIKNN